MMCEKHRVRLRPEKDNRGRTVYRCPYPHIRHYEETSGAVCRRCKKESPHAEGLCYTCWYYGH